MHTIKILALAALISVGIWYIQPEDQKWVGLAAIPTSIFLSALILNLVDEHRNGRL